MGNGFDKKLGSTYIRPMLRVLGGAVGALVIAGVALAEDPPATGTPGTGTSGQSAALEESAGLSPAEKKDRAESMLADMRSALQRATEILQEARAARDIVQLNCVNEKLTQIKGLLKISEQASVRMYEAIADGQEERVNHEYTKIAVAHHRVLILRAEADYCVGEQTIYSGDTEVSVEIDPSLDGADPTDPIVPPLGPVVPPIATPF